jgi:hypothetical protein
LSRRKPASSAFGAVPISVPTPPIDAAYATPNISATANPCVASRPHARRAHSTTDSATANIIIVVEVLLIHIEVNAVAAIKPATIPPGVRPSRFTMLSASRSCRPDCCIPCAMINPPRNKNTIGSA